MKRWRTRGWASRARSGVLCAAILGFSVAATAATAARAEETVQITQAAFSPDLLGVPTNAFGSATIGSTNLPVPSPITHVSVFGPAGVTLDLEGSGTCSARQLEQAGPKACPPNSRAGFGGGLGAYEIGKEIVRETFAVEFFLGDNRPGHVALLVYLTGHSPVQIELVFKASVINGPKPYGLGFSLEVPLIKVLPEASDASATTAFLTLGAHNVAYYRTVHGKRELFHVRGIITPRKCPRGGWPVESQFGFEDGSTVTAKSSIRCPHR